MTIIKYKNLEPIIDDSVYISEGVRIAGDVKIAEGCSIWFNSVLRGDVAPIVIKARTNIQDNVVIHTSRHNGGADIGYGVTIGHSAIIHAATIHDHVLVGMGAIILDRAVLEPYSFIAAGAVVSPGKVVKSGELWAGVPAKFVRNITDEEKAEIEESRENYVKLANEYKK